MSRETKVVPRFRVNRWGCASKVRQGPARSLDSLLARVKLASLSLDSRPIIKYHQLERFSA